MANRIITAAVSGEKIKLSNRLAGASGSHNAVSLAMTFDSAWDGTTKKIYFFDRDGENAVYRLLTVDLLVDGAYIVPIPSEPLAKSGDMTITIRGVEMDGETAERIIMSASTTMKVDEAVTPDSDVAPVEPTPTQAEQLQEQIDNILGTITNAQASAAAAHASEVNAASSATSASGSASAASASATAAASSASASAGSASAAAASEGNAAASALAAAGSASTASASATTASTKASEAATSATNAANSATTATTKANEAANSKTAAETAQAGAISAKNDAITAKTAAETARTGAEAARDSAQDIVDAFDSHAADLKSDFDSNAAAANTTIDGKVTIATNAATAAQTAQGLSEGARDTSIAAKNEAITAKTAAETAQGLAQTAKTGADTAKAGADAAKTGAESARDTAITAKDDAVIAKNSAQSAQTAAETAKGQAETAKTGAETAATTAGNRALDSEAYGAGTRNGVAVTVGDPAYQNNAKYYKDQAGEIVGGDFATKTEAQGFANTAETNAKNYADTQIAAIPPVDISGKVDKVAGKGLSTEDYTTAEKTKLSSIADNANNYVHPTTAGNKHIPTGGASGQILRYSASGTAVWGADNDTITTINGKTGAIDKADIVALGIPAQDTVYTHPANHPPSIITQDASNRFVSDAEKAAWNAKLDASQKGVANGIASLDGTGKVPSGQLPTTVAAHKASHSVGGADALIDSDIGLTPAVATALGLTGNPQVKDALEKLSGAAMRATKHMTISQLADGAEFTLYEIVGGVRSPVTFIKLKNNYEGSGRVLIIRKSVTTEKFAFTASGSVAIFDGGPQDVFCNTTYLSRLDVNIQSLISDVAIKYSPTAGTTTVSTINRKAFPLSATELGGNAASLSFNVEGTAIPYFSSDARRAANATRYWTRTPRNSGTYAIDIAPGGAVNGPEAPNAACAARPAFTLPADFIVSELDENSLTDMFGNDFPLPYAKIETGSYTGTGTYGSGNPNSYTFSSVPKLVLIARSNGYAVGAGGSASPINWGTTFQVIVPGIALSTYFTSAGITTTSLVGNTLVWYNDKDAASQMNTNTAQYTVIGVTV